MGLVEALRTHHSAAAKVRGNAAAPKPKQDAFLAVFGDAVLHSTARSQDSILSSFGGRHLLRPPCLKDPADAATDATIAVTQARSHRRPLRCRQTLHPPPSPAAKVCKALAAAFPAPGGTVAPPGVVAPPGQSESSAAAAERGACAETAPLDDAAGANKVAVTSATDAAGSQNAGN
jgi:hypothetical protein